MWCLCPGIGERVGVFFVVDRRSWRVGRKVCGAFGRIVLLLCGVFGCFRVCAEPESWPVLLGRGGGATADAPTLVFSRVGVGKEGEGTC